MGEKQFFKMLTLTELFNRFENGEITEEVMTRIDPIQMFLQAKYIEELPFNQFQSWIQKHIQSKIKKYDYLKVP